VPNTVPQPPSDSPPGSPVWLTDQERYSIAAALEQIAVFQQAAGNIEAAANALRTRRKTLRGLLDPTTTS
jgi:hypothetical protein